MRSDGVKHSPLGLLSFDGRDEAPRYAFGTSPASNPLHLPVYKQTPVAHLDPAHSFTPLIILAYQ
jgi:hypothetical protein